MSTPFKLLFLLLFLIAGLPASVQSNDKVKAVPLDRPVVVDADNVQGKLALVRRLMRAKNYLGASAILEGLYENDSQNTVVQNVLQTCYLQLRYYTKAETLALRQIEQNPVGLGHRLLLAEVLIMQGRRDEALTAYNEALELISHGDPARYLVVIRSMIGHDLEDRALELIDTARIRTDDPRLYALERGSILERRKEYSQAANEYLPLLAEDTTARATGAEGKLLALLGFPESSSEVENALLIWAGETASARTLKLLTSHYLKTGRYDEAFLFALRQDSLEGEGGQLLLQFMLHCQERKAHSQAVRMGEYILQHYPESDISSDVSFRYARSLTEIGRTGDAMDVYDRIITTHPDSQQEANALWEMGWIYYHYLNDCSSALAFFDSVVSRQPRGMSYLNARKSIPYCYLRLGKLKDAEKGFENLSRLKINDDIAEEIDYNLALVKFFQKQHDSAEVALRKLIVDYPRGFYVNDALQLVLLFSEAEGAEELLYDYSNALFFEQCWMYDSARVQLERIAGAGNRALADVALFRLSELELNRQDTLEALGFVDRLCEEFPDSYYVPYAMKAKADVLVHDDSRQEEALALYRRLLEDFPNCPFISEVRQRLRELEIDRRIG